MDENPVGRVSVSVNGRYPDAVPISTVPPDVLQTLPKLTEDMEYRFIGDSLIILDAHAHIIADYIPNAIPWTSESHGQRPSRRRCRRYLVRSHRQRLRTQQPGRSERRTGTARPAECRLTGQPERVLQIHRPGRFRYGRSRAIPAGDADGLPAQSVQVRDGGARRRQLIRLRAAAGFREKVRATLQAAPRRRREVLRLPW